MTQHTKSVVRSSTYARSLLLQHTVVRRILFLCVGGCWLLSTRSLVAQALTDTRHTAKVPTGTVYGTVSLPTGAPAAHARIEAVGTHDTTFADTFGSYTLSGLSAGISTLKISRAGADSLTIRVIVPDEAKLRVDVVLSKSVNVAPDTLSPVLVRCAMPDPVDPTATVPHHMPGVWQWAGNVQDAPETTGEPDAFRLLASDPQEMMRADGFGGTAVDAATGSLADRVFVDGLPVWNAVHGIRVLAAIDPDVVSGLSVSDGSASARYGDALFETVELQTREITRDKPSFGAGLGPATLRGWWADRIRIGAVDGQLVVAARRNSDGMTSSGSEANSVADRWADGVTALSLHHGSSNLRLVAIGSRDRLAADIDDATVGATSDTARVASPDQMLNARWQSETVGGVWTQRLSRSHKLVTRAWDAAFATSANPGSPTGAAAMANRARNIGFASDLDLASVAVGVSIEKIHTSYSLAVASGDSLGNSNPTILGTDRMLRSFSQHEATSDPAVFSAYAERHWGSVGGRWFATSGARVTSLSRRAPYVEPRLSASVEIGKGVSVTAGYAGTHQFVQALRDFSLAPTALMPVSLPIAAGSAGVPVAAARTFMGDLSKNLGSNTRLTLDAYERKFNGLLVTNPARMPLAPGGTFNILDGRMLGLGGTAQSTLRNVRLHLTYGSQRAILTQQSASYFPAHQLAQTVSTAVEWRALPTTTLRLFGSFGSSLLATGNPADADGSEANIPDVGASPESRLLGATGWTSSPLPAYMRVDLALSHEWRAAGTGRFVLTAELANIFDRSNVVPLQSGDERIQHLFALTPRSLMIGISWRQ